MVGGSNVMHEVSVWRAAANDTIDREQGKLLGRAKEWTPDIQYRRIGEGAFKNNTKLKRAVFPKSVKEIGVQSFYNTMLRKVEIYGTVSIRKEAFFNCVKLQSIDLPYTTNRIGKRAFAQCKNLEHAVIHPESSCKEIAEESFSGCSNLKEVILPKTLETICRRAFYKCTSLEYICLPQNLKAIGQEAFYQTALQHIELPKGLEIIGDSAFLKCNQLEYVKIPESVKYIEKWAFHGCNRLKVLEISHEPEIVEPWIINRSAKIRCRKGGKMEQYCIQSGFEMEYIEN